MLDSFMELSFTLVLNTLLRFDSKDLTGAVWAHCMGYQIKCSVERERKRWSWRWTAKKAQEQDERRKRGETLGRITRRWSRRWCVQSNFVIDLLLMIGEDERTRMGLKQDCSEMIRSEVTRRWRLEARLAVLCVSLRYRIRSEESYYVVGNRLIVAIH